MKTRLIIPICLIIIIGALLQSTSKESFSYENFEGYITEDDGKSAKFYLQENESGFIIELKFTNEDTEVLSFKDFGYVSVEGHYNNVGNYLIVNSIEGLDKTFHKSLNKDIASN